MHTERLGVIMNGVTGRMGYWGSTDVDKAMDVVRGLIDRHAGRIDGIKVSLLEERYEIALRAASLPAGVKLYTGDDFNYPQLIKGDGERHSHALLGIFDPIAPVAAEAIGALRDGRGDDYDRLLALSPTGCFRSNCGGTTRCAYSGWSPACRSMTRPDRW